MRDHLKFFVQVLASTSEQNKVWQGPVHSIPFHFLLQALAFYFQSKLSGLEVLPVISYIVDFWSVLISLSMPFLKVNLSSYGTISFGRVADTTHLKQLVNLPYWVPFLNSAHYHDLPSPLGLSISVYKPILNFNKLLLKYLPIPWSRFLKNVPSYWNTYGSP